jgi:hypothetical protein
MRGIKAGIAGLIVLSVLAAGTGSAHASGIPGFGKQPTIRSFYGSANVGGGYAVYLYASGGLKSDRGFAGIDIAQDTGRGYSASSYFSRHRGEVSNRRMSHRLGSAGGVDMRFVPTEPAETRRGRCFEYETRRGVLVGGLRFEGEGGYVEVNETRLPARRTTFDFRKCDPFKPGGGVGGKEEKAAAQLTACVRRPDVTWQATRLPDRSTTITGFGRSSWERGLFTSSFVHRKIRPGGFEYASDFTTATLTPPAPFLGTGVYADGAVEGDLRWVAPNGDVNPMATDEATLAKSDRRACAGIITTGQAAQRAALRRPSKRTLPNLATRP